MHNALLHHTSIQNRCEDHRLVCGQELPLVDGSSCDDTASPSGSDALSISAAICSCWAIAFSRCSFNQGVVASARSLRALAAAAR